MSGEVSFSEFEFRSAELAKLRERAEHAEAMLEKARGIMDNMSKAGAQTEAELAQWRATFGENALTDARAKLAELDRFRQTVPVVDKLVDMIAQMPERPGVHWVRNIRAAATRVRITFGWVNR
jgi:hypothetical protein